METGATGESIRSPGTSFDSSSPPHLSESRVKDSTVMQIYTNGFADVVLYLMVILVICVSITIWQEKVPSKVLRSPESTSALTARYESPWYKLLSTKVIPLMTSSIFAPARAPNSVVTVTLYESVSGHRDSRLEAITEAVSIGT